MACWLEPHWRSTVVPGTDSGKPAARTALRPTLAVCSPTCMTQPAITSSISAGSSLLRATRPLSVKPRRSTGCQDFNVPSRRPSGVRIASMITASLFIFVAFAPNHLRSFGRVEFFSPCTGGLATWSASPPYLYLLCSGAGFLIKIGEALAFFGQTLEQRRGLPELSVLFMEFADAIVNFFQSDRVRIPHWAAAVRREAVAGEINDVDIDSAQRIAFFQNTRAFVNQGIDQAINNFFFGNCMLLHAGFRRPLAHVFFHRGIKNGAAIFIILVPACAGLLAVTT